MDEQTLRLPRITFQQVTERYANGKTLISQGTPCFVCHSPYIPVIKAGSVQLLPMRRTVKARMNDLANSPPPEGSTVTEDRARDQTEEAGTHCCESCMNLVAAIDFLQEELDKRLTCFHQLRKAKTEAVSDGSEVTDTGGTGVLSNEDAPSRGDGTDAIENEQSSFFEHADDPDDEDFVGDEEESLPKRRRLKRAVESNRAEEKLEALIPQRKSRRTLSVHPKVQESGDAAQPLRTRSTRSVLPTAHSKNLSKIAGFVEKRFETIGLLQWLKPSDCRLCDATFEETDAEAPIDRRLKHHRHVHSKEPLFVCHFCLAGFNSPTSFTCHVMHEELLRSQDGEFKCRFCDEDQVNPRRLDGHFKEKHPTERIVFVCDDCNEPFQAYDDFITHRQRKSNRPLFGDAKPPGSNGYVCPRCGDDYKSTIRLESHYSCLEFATLRNCDECGLHFATEEDWEKHVTREHRRALPYACTVCAKSFESKSLLDHHLKFCPKPSPSSAPSKPATIADFIERRKETIGFLQWCRPNHCRLCEAEFEDQEGGEGAIARRLNHQANVHKGEAPFVCHFCLAGFSSVHAFSCHVMAEELARSAEKEFSCKVCEEDLVNPRRLETHYKREHPEKQEVFTCDNCSQSFQTYDAFIVHRQKKTDRPMFGDENPPTEEGFVCPRCGDRQKLLRRLENHLAGVEFGSARNCDECGLHFRVGRLQEQHYNRDHLQQRPCTCTICGKGFESKAHLSMHMDYHLKPKPPQICPICGVEIKGFLKYHIADKHQKAHRHKCDFCEERFVYRPGLKRHMALAHGHRVDRYQHPCDVCGRIFTKAPSLRDHKFVAHGVNDPAIKIRKCKECGKEFSKPEKLRRHERIHSGLRPHACPHCDHRTCDFVNLKTHIRLKHKRLVKRVFRSDTAAEMDYDIVDADPQEEQERKEKARPGFGVNLMQQAQAVSTVDS